MAEERLNHVPEAFIEQVKQALAQLYNFSFLQNHSLVEQISLVAQSDESAGHHLRRALIQAIDTLNPGTDVYFRSPDGRIYNLLKLYYIDRMTLQEAALELAISERQAYRDLRQGQISVAELLWDAPVLTQERTGASLSPIQVEVERLRDNFRAVDLVGLLHMAQKVVQQLAYQYETPLNIALPDTSVTLKVNVPIAQQVLVDLLSYCIKQAQSHTLQVTLEKSDQQLKLCLRYVRHVNAADTPLRMTHIPQLTEQLKWQILQQRRQDEMVIQLVLRASRSTLMIIDDNEDLAELVARYLTGSNYDILAYDSSPEGLRRARETLPTAILLDVMMPEMNGWEFLQRLRTYPETETIPVIICSVIHDVELAYSLGASYLIPKPMTQDRLFEAFSALHLF